MSLGAGQADAEEDVVDKSPDAFRTISEVAEDLDLPHHVLRFWETRFTQIKPLKRGGGRRYYRPDDVALIMGLKALLYGQGYTIKGVQRILKEQGVKTVQAIGRGAPVGQHVAPPRPEDAEEAPAPRPATACAKRPRVRPLAPPRHRRPCPRRPRAAARTMPFTTDQTAVLRLALEPRSRTRARPGPGAG